jgi:hypothetical protein
MVHRQDGNCQHSAASFSLHSLPHVSRDLLAALIVLGLIVAYGLVAWGKMPSAFADQGWGLQVAARVLEGDKLYKDVMWNYGPLPVYAFVLLFRLLGVDVQTFSLVGLVITASAYLLIYRIHRYLLQPGMALLGTVTVLFTFDGGFRSHMTPYTTAVSWGALFGLITVWGLLISVERQRTYGLVLAGLSSGCALLTKLEFAAACMGASLSYLALILLFPGTGISRQRGERRALGGIAASARGFLPYLCPLLLVAGSGYGLLSWQASWADITSGLSGYGIFWNERVYLEWLGSYNTWLYIVAGLGLDLLFLILYVSVTAPSLFKRYRRLILVLASACAIGSLSALLPRILRLGIRDTLDLIASLFTSAAYSQIGAAMARINANRATSVWWVAILSSGTLFLTGALLGLILNWVKTYARGKRELPAIEQKLGVLVAYSCLATARFYFAFPIATQDYHVNTLAPVAIFFLAQWIPRKLAASGLRTLRIRRGHALLVVAMLLWVAGNLWWGMVYFYNVLDHAVASPRGTVMMSRYAYTELFMQPLQSIISETQEGDHVYVLGPFPGLYFLSGRRNPTRLDYVDSSMDYSAAEVDDMLARLEGSQPKLVIIHEFDRQWFESQVDTRGQLTAFLRKHYRLTTVVVDYLTIYERRNSASQGASLSTKKGAACDQGP